MHCVSEISSEVSMLRVYLGLALSPNMQFSHVATEVTVATVQQFA